ncbi:NUDIX domain-containing protein [Egicoccus sp. AB-alg2]|uniref:NUDIX domain-containing protein n=1 Tax=Egicoccus sp. AB-alg2 TaxID=3242693 RepID=UPI00359CF03E
MTARRSAGLLLYRFVDGDLQVLLAHMGGPFWARRDAGAWSIPKGEYADDEAPLAAARREFTEELGVPVPDGEVVALGEVSQSGGKVVSAFALHADLDPDAIEPGTFTMEWPKGSGREQAFPEVDRVAWFDPATAEDKLVTAQRAFLERLRAAVAG